MKTQLTENEIYDTVVIGAGFAGAFTTEEICRRTGHKVLLIEAGNGLLGPTSSSYNECYKLHTGVHYAGHVETAVQCLKDSIQFARDFPDYILGYEDTHLPWRHGRHYLMSNSLFDEAKVRDTCEALRTTYQEQIKKDPRNKVFGEPEDFIRYLTPNEYPHVAFSIPQEKESNANVALGIETAESQINLGKFKQDLERKLNAREQLTFITQHTVERTDFSADSLNYRLQVRDLENKTTKYIETKSVVNCSWQNIETLDKSLGYYAPDGRLVRIKVSLLVYLPQALKQINTCIFFAGPHCSITNLGDGTAVVTYEPATNAGYYPSGRNPVHFDHQLKDLISQPLTPNEGKGKEVADAIMEGAAHYIPSLKNAMVKEVRVGHVKIFVKPDETYSISDKNSPIHRRTEDGVEQKGLCYLAHSGMKMTYTHNGAEKTRKILALNFSLRNILDHLITAVRDELERELDENIFGKTLANITLYHTFRQFMLSQIRLTLDNAGDLVDPKIIETSINVIADNIIKKNKINLAILKGDFKLKSIEQEPNHEEPPEEPTVRVTRSRARRDSDEGDHPKDIHESPASCSTAMTRAQKRKASDTDTDKKPGSPRKRNDNIHRSPSSSSTVMAQEEEEKRKPSTIYTSNKKPTLFGRALFQQADTIPQIANRPETPPSPLKAC